MYENIFWAYNNLVVAEADWDSKLTALGAGGVLAILILKEVFGFLKVFQERRKGSADEKSPSQSQIIELPQAEVYRRLESIARAQEEQKLIINNVSSKVTELYKWHDVNIQDQPGVKVWWGGQLDRRIDNIAQLMSELHSDNEKLAKFVNRLNEELEKIRPRRGP